MFDPNKMTDEERQLLEEVRVLQHVCDRLLGIAHEDHRGLRGELLDPS